MRLVSHLLLLAALLASALPAWAQASDRFPTGALKEMQIVRNISGGRVTGTKGENRFEIKKVLSPQLTETPSGCAGDCEGDGTVTVDEILTMVNIALGNSDVSACEAGDANGDAQITVDEILAAVNSALSGCSGRIYCRTPSGGSPIPDDDPLGGVWDTMTIAEALPISDLKVRLQIAHSWVGDLVVTLHHVDDLSSATLIDRPGVPGISSVGCGHSDILCTLDDAATAAVQDQCADTGPAIAGTLRPNEPLSTFNGESSAGDWILSVYDESPDDTGSLVSWCLEVNAAPPAGISVTVSPATTSLGQGETQQFTATVTGTTNTAVTWSVLEGDPGGTITSDGLYTAPSAPGTFHPMAESQADPSQNGIATVVVTGTCSGGVSVTPAVVSLGLRKLQNFTSSSVDTSTIWSVQEGPAGGFVSADGDYEAPRNPGTYHVLARSADLTSCGSATVTVVDDSQISETRSASVGPAGGVVALPSGPALEIPAGAAASPVTATLSLVGNDPDFGDENHLVLGVSLSGSVSAASLRVPVPAGRDASTWAAAYLMPDSGQVIVLSGAVNQAGDAYTMDLSGAAATAPPSILSGRYVVEWYERRVNRSSMGTYNARIQPMGTYNTPIQAPYYEQYAPNACWAAALLDFNTTYNSAVKSNAVYKILHSFGISKNNGLWEDIYFNGNSTFLALWATGQSKHTVRWIAWFDLPNFASFVMDQTDAGKPVLASFKSHQGLFLGYEQDDSGKVSLIYHDPDISNQYPYRKITTDQFWWDYWLSLYPARTYVASDVPGSPPVLQTIHMPDKPLGAGGISWLAGNFHQGIGLGRGADLVDWVEWDHTQATGYKHTAKGGDLSEVPRDFTDVLIGDVPVWNMDRDRPATVTVRTSIQRMGSGGPVLPAIWVRQVPATIPAFIPFDLSDKKRSRYSYSLKIPAGEFMNQLLPTDSQFTLLVELLDANDKRLGYFDVVFPIPPCVTNPFGSRFGTSDASTCGANTASFQRTWTDYVTNPVGDAFAYTNDFSVTISGQFKSVEERISTTAIPKHSLLVHAPTSDLQISGSASATFNVPSRVDNGDFYYLITPVGSPTYSLDDCTGGNDLSSPAFSTVLAIDHCHMIRMATNATFHFVGYYKPDNSQAGSPFDHPYYPIVLWIETTSE